MSKLILSLGLRLIGTLVLVRALLENTRISVVDAFAPSYQNRRNGVYSNSMQVPRLLPCNTMYDHCSSGHRRTLSWALASSTNNNEKDEDATPTPDNDNDTSVEAAPSTEEAETKKGLLGRIFGSGKAKQKLSKMGINMVLSYGFVSNVSGCIGVAIAWFLFSKRVRGAYDT